MIERVARALAFLNCSDQAEADRCWINYKDDARCAIEAMREPTAEMLLAAAPFPVHLVIERADIDYTRNMEAATIADRMAARSKYQTMIDAALNAEESK